LILQRLAFGSVVAADALSLSVHFLQSWRSDELAGLLETADTVEKLDKNGGLFFCKKPNHHELPAATSM